MEPPIYNLQLVKNTVCGFICRQITGNDVHLFRTNSFELTVTFQKATIAVQSMWLYRSVCATLLHLSSVTCVFLSIGCIILCLLSGRGRGDGGFYQRSFDDVEGFGRGGREMHRSQSWEERYHAGMSGAQVSCENSGLMKLNTSSRQISYSCNLNW